MTRVRGGYVGNYSSGSKSSAPTSVLSPWYSTKYSKAVGLSMPFQFQELLLHYYTQSQSHYIEVCFRTRDFWREPRMLAVGYSSRVWLGQSLVPPLCSSLTSWKWLWINFDDQQRFKTHSNCRDKWVDLKNKQWETNHNSQSVAIWTEILIKV